MLCVKVRTQRDKFAPSDLELVNPLVLVGFAVGGLATICPQDGNNHMPGWPFDQHTARFKSQLWKEPVKPVKPLRKGALGMTHTAERMIAGKLMMNVLSASRQQGGDITFGKAVERPSCCASCDHVMHVCLLNDCFDRYHLRSGSGGCEGASLQRSGTENDFVHNATRPEREKARDDQGKRIKGDHAALVRGDLVSVRPPDR